MSSAAARSLRLQCAIPAPAPRTGTVVRTLQSSVLVELTCSSFDDVTRQLRSHFGRDLLELRLRRRGELEDLVPEQWSALEPGAVHEGVATLGDVLSGRAVQELMRLGAYDCSVWSQLE
eukprot:gene1945-5375_t